MIRSFVFASVVESGFECGLTRARCSRALAFYPSPLSLCFVLSWFFVGKSDLFKKQSSVEGNFKLNE